jgi:hypothetical protein
MPPSKKVPCNCPKCGGILVSDRTERKHRNRPDSVHLERPAGRKRQRAESTPPGPHSGPEITPDHKRPSEVNEDESGDDIYEVGEHGGECSVGASGENECSVSLISIKYTTTTSRILCQM